MEGHGGPALTPELVDALIELIEQLVDASYEVPAAEVARIVATSSAQVMVAGGFVDALAVTEAVARARLRAAARPAGHALRKAV